jgi:hypothetical protein
MLLLLLMIIIAVSALLALLCGRRLVCVSIPSPWAKASFEKLKR